MNKKNVDFLKKYFDSASNKTTQGEHFFAQNILLNEIAKHLAPVIMHKKEGEKCKHGKGTSDFCEPCGRINSNQ